jgi:hypothetical protein
LVGGTDFMVKFPTEDKRGGFGKAVFETAQMHMINEKAEHEFNDDESRIPFQGENYMMEKSAMSIHFDFDTSHIGGGNAQHKRDFLSPIARDANDNN